MSSTTLSKEKLAELVKCVLCMKTFTSPQTMKCLHTFCKHCLESHAKRSSVDDVQGVECPQCKHFTAHGGVTACTHTEQLLSLYECGAKRWKCFECETEPAEWKCQDCGDFYCGTCKEPHCRIRKFKDHVFVAVKELEQDVRLPHTVKCTEHSSEEARFFCFDCNVLLCSLCLLHGHGTHKRDTVHNAVDHVKSKVDEKLAAVKQITNERFLRAEKLKDTRLLIQTYADESLDAIKSRYLLLKQELEEDYQLLTEKLKSSVDAELKQVNAAIVAEEAKQSHASAVSSYVENTLAMTAGALCIQESFEQLIPTMTNFCAENDALVEPLLTTHICRFNTTKSMRFDGNLIGKIDIVSADFHSRYQPVMTKAKFESAAVGKTIDITLGQVAECLRISSKFGKIVLCFHEINTIRIYSVDGVKLQELDLTDLVRGPTSAVFVNNAELLVATDYGLVMVDVVTSKVVANLNDQSHFDVFHMDNCIYAVRKPGHIEIYKGEKLDWKVVKSIPLGHADRNFTLSVYATIVVSRSAIYFCNAADEVLQYSLSGELLQKMTLNERARERFLCTVDADGRMLLSIDGQLVLQGNDQRQFVNVQDITLLQDIVFSDQYTFWIMDVVSASEGKCRLVKYNIS